jgi:hypothetical protein
MTRQTRRLGRHRARNNHSLLVPNRGLDAEIGKLLASGLTTDKGVTMELVRA